MAMDSIAVGKTCTAYHPTSEAAPFTIRELINMLQDSQNRSHAIIDSLFERFGEILTNEQSTPVNTACPPPVDPNCQSAVARRIYEQIQVQDSVNDRLNYFLTRCNI